ncbi:hypothetical protein SCA31_23920, partial [Chryseobacterium sp. SIMBA_028]
GSDERIVRGLMFLVVHRRANFDGSGVMFGHEYRLPQMPGPHSAADRLNAMISSACNGSIPVQGLHKASGKRNA